MEKKKRASELHHAETGLTISVVSEVSLFMGRGAIPSGPKS